MQNLILFKRNKEIHIDTSGNVLEGDIVGKVHYFRIERYDTWTYYRNEKHYPSFKEAFKSAIGKVKKHPGTGYSIYMHYFDKVYNDSTSTFFFYLCMNEEQVVTLRFGYDKEFVCRFYLEDGSVEFDKGDINEANTWVADWLPKKRNLQATPLQKRIESFKAFNIQKIDFKGIVTDERKEIFFKELEYCFEQINKIFSVNNFYPVQEIYFSKYTKARGKYGQAKISLHPDSYYAVRDTVYHEYGHQLFDIGQLGNYPNYYKNKVERHKAVETMDKIINILYKEETLMEIQQRAETRMSLRNKKASNLQDIEKYRSKHEQYLLEPTEVFARLFEAFMLSLDKAKGESLPYQLDFTEKEIEKVKPLLLDYLQTIQQDYAKEQATS